MLNELLSAELFVTFMVFVRVGAAFVTLPSIGETFLNPRARLAIALLTSVIVAPVVAPLIPERPPSIGGMAVLLIGEAVIGFFIASVSRILFSALAIAGVIWSFLNGLASAMMFNPLISGQGGLQSILFTLLGLLLIYATDLHHLLIRTVVESYVMFKPGRDLMLGDMADVIARMVADAFKLGVQLAGPAIVVALMFYTLLGLLARLMPQLQIFFIAMPAQILMGLIVMILTISGVMMAFLEEFREMLAMFL